MIYLKNEAETFAFGERIGRAVVAGDVLILKGDLGVGKTSLTKGIAKGLEIAQMVKSPTYTIARTYEGRLRLHHLDIYRIGNDPDSIALDDFLADSAVLVIEWGDLLEESLFEDYLLLALDYDKEGRRLHLTAQKDRSKQLLAAILEK